MDSHKESSQARLKTEGSSRGNLGASLVEIKDIMLRTVISSNLKIEFDQDIEDREASLRRSRAISNTSLVEIKGKRGNWKDLRAFLGLCRSRLETGKGLIGELTVISGQF